MHLKLHLNLVISYRFHLHLHLHLHEFYPQHYMESQIVQLGLWGNVVEKNMRVKGTDFENLGFSFELPR